MIARILCTDLAGLRAQALGLTAAAGLTPDVRVLHLREPWRRISPALWPVARWAVDRQAVAEPLAPVVIGCGGAGSRVAASLRCPGVVAVAVQHPRMSIAKFDLVVAAAHDGLAAGPNVIVTRTALHQVTPAVLAAGAELWRPVFAQIRRPLVSVLLGGSNGRYRFGKAEAAVLADQLAALAAGLVITPSRRTAPEAVALLRARLGERAWIWDGTGENPYFGMLALADAIVVTADSVSMASEAVATRAPVFLVRLPGKSTRIGSFMDSLVACGRARNFAGRLELWDTAPLNDTPAAGAELRRRLGL